MKKTGLFPDRHHHDRAQGGLRLAQPVGGPGAKQLGNLIQ
jgi:hypothetical protein